MAKTTLEILGDLESVEDRLYPIRPPATSQAPSVLRSLFSQVKAAKKGGKVTSSLENLVRSLMDDMVSDFKKPYQILPGNLREELQPPDYARGKMYKGGGIGDKRFIPNPDLPRYTKPQFLEWKIREGKFRGRTFESLLGTKKGKDELSKIAERKRNSSRLRAAARDTLQYGEKRDLFKNLIKTPLKFLSPDTKLFHTTHPRNLSSIEQRGLFPEPQYSGFRFSGDVPEQLMYPESRPLVQGGSRGKKGPIGWGTFFSTDKPDIKRIPYPLARSWGATLKDYSVFEARLGDLVKAGIIPDIEVARSITGRGIPGEIQTAARVPPELLKTRLRGSALPALLLSVLLSTLVAKES